MSPRTAWTVAAALLGPAGAAAQTYVVQELDANGQITFGAALGLAQSGVAVGVANPLQGPGSQPFVWDAAGSHKLPILPGDNLGIAAGLNELGQAVGTSTDVVQMGQLTFFFDHATLWNGATVVELATLVTGGDTALELLNGVDVNDAGRILVRARDAAAQKLVAAVLDDGLLSALPDIGGFGGSEPFALTEAGAVVGRATAVSQFQHAFLWKDGVMTDLHALAGLPGRTSTAWSANRLGQVAGSADWVADFIDFETATIWEPDGKATDYGTLGGQQAFVQSINDAGTGVGSTNLVNGEARAFLLQNGLLRDLNDLIPPGSGWLLTAAEEINNQGRIVGQGLFQGALLPYVLLPVCGGSAASYGAGCPGSSGAVPELSLIGCPEPGNAITFELAGAPALAPTFVLFGTGSGVLPLAAGCALELLPLLPDVVALASGADGGWLLSVELAASTPTADVNLQVVALDFALPALVVVSNALAVHVP